MFHDRAEAGRQLGAALAGREWHDPLVLALPRGGVPVGAEVARCIGADLDVFVVCKIRVPQQAELGMGAVAEDGSVVVSQQIVDAVGVRRRAFDRARSEAAAEVERRVVRYRGARAAPVVTGRDVVVVDDGLATGVTAEAALGALAGRSPRRRVFAAPVGAPDTVRRLRAVADEVVCLDQPAAFGAVGAHYERFAATPDADVLELLGRWSASGERRPADDSHPDRG